MRVVVVINRIAELTERQTTWMLIAELANRDVDLFVAEADGVTLGSDGFEVQAARVPIAIDIPPKPGEEQVGLSHGDLVLLRTNPGRDVERSALHDELLTTLMAAEEQGIRVINRPQYLQRMAAKTSLFELDEQHRPAGFVSRNADDVFAFILDAESDCIVKPVVGSRGRDVLLISSELMPDEQSQIEELVSREEVICQHFVEWDQPGDIRVVVLNGEPLAVEGRIAAIHRVPAADDFRGNLHAGGTAQPIELSSSMIKAVTHAATHLNKHGISLAGIDLVGDQIIEMNVFSTGGLFDASRFYKREFVTQLVGHVLDDTGG